MNLLGDDAGVPTTHAETILTAVALRTSQKVNAGICLDLVSLPNSGSDSDAKDNPSDPCDIPSRHQDGWYELEFAVLVSLITKLLPCGVALRSGAESGVDFSSPHHEVQKESSGEHVPELPVIRAS